MPPPSEGSRGADAARPQWPRRSPSAYSGRSDVRPGPPGAISKEHTRTSSLPFPRSLGRTAFDRHRRIPGRHPPPTLGAPPASSLSNTPRKYNFNHTDPKPNERTGKSETHDQRRRARRFWHVASPRHHESPRAQCSNLRSLSPISSTEPERSNYKLCGQLGITETEREEQQDVT